MATSIFRRPFDFLCAFYFILHIPTTVIVDAQAVFPREWFPKFATDLLDFHINTNGDYLMKAPPAWFKANCCAEVFLQLPFFFFAAHAVITGNNRMRWPIAIYSVHVVTTLIAILGDILFSGLAGSNAIPLAAIYFPYFLLPLIMAVRMYVLEKPFGDNKSKDE